MSRLLSGIPFGPSIYFLLLLALLIIGCIFSLQRSNRWRLGLPLLALGIFLTALEFRLENIDLNPRVQRAEIIGVWKDGSNSLTLEEDGKYILVWDQVEHKGTWNNDDFRLLLSPDIRYRNFYPRIVKTGSKLRILTDYKGADDWSGDLGLSKR